MQLSESLVSINQLGRRWHHDYRPKPYNIQEYVIRSIRRDVVGMPKAISLFLTIDHVNKLIRRARDPDVTLNQALDTSGMGLGPLRSKEKDPKMCVLVLVHLWRGDMETLRNKTHCSLQMSAQGLLSKKLDSCESPEGVILRSGLECHPPTYSGKYRGAACLIEIDVNHSTKHESGYSLCSTSSMDNVSISWKFLRSSVRRIFPWMVAWVKPPSKISLASKNIMLSSIAWSACLDSIL
jgi:hypothetical protein